MTVGRWAIFLAMSACERATPAEPTREVEDRLGAVRCKLEAGKVSCLGDNTWGLVRSPATKARVETWSLIPIPEDVVSMDLSPMSRFACATGVSGATYCWGDAAGGKLGNGEVPDWPIEDGATARATPQRVRGVSDARAVRLGITHACVITRRGSVSCWGDGAWGELGQGRDRPPSGTAIEVLATGVAEMVVTDAQTCALLDGGRVSCWGGAIPLASETVQRVYSPTEVPGIDDATAVASERSEMCVSRRSGARTCWTPMDWPPDLR